MLVDVFNEIIEHPGTGEVEMSGVKWSLIPNVHVLAVAHEDVRLAPALPPQVAHARLFQQLRRGPEPS